jgi:hypothetical protein
MHSSRSKEDEPEVKVETSMRQEPKKVEVEPEPARPVHTPSYTTRVLDEPKKVEPVKPKVKAEDSASKKPTEAKKKLLFRRSAK